LKQIESTAPKEKDAKKQALVRAPKNRLRAERLSCDRDIYFIGENISPLTE